MKNRTFWETIEAKGDALIDKLRQLIAEGNVRRVRIRQHGRTVAEFPLTIGVVGAVLAPVLAAVGAVTALITDCTVDVQRTQVMKAPPVPAVREPVDAEC
jgi:uncharacterized integral membrane protein